MRLWSIHPRHLDCKGLVALWREALLARAVLRGETMGYRRHPQLERFKAHPSPPDAIDYYLSEVWSEGARRGYSFNAAKIGAFREPAKIPVTDGQMTFETAHLASKLRTRDPAKEMENRLSDKMESHPLFQPVPGEIEPWEVAPQLIPAPTRRVSRRGRGP